MERADAAVEPNSPERPAEGADRLGHRTAGRGADGRGVDTFAVCPALSDRPEFCAALAAGRGAGERGGPGLARLIGLHVPSGREARLVLLHQEWVAGERLASVAARRRRSGRTFSAGHLLFVLRETAAALRLLHGRGAGWCHGALSPHRLLLTADDRLVLAENVLGPGLAAIGVPPAWLEEQFGLAVPVVPGVPSFTPLTDQLQLGRLAVELLVGSTPAFEASALRDQVAALAVAAADGTVAPLAEPVRAALGRMLLLSPEGPYRSMAAVERALDELVAALPECKPVVPPVEPEELPPAAPARRPPSGLQPAFVVTTNTGEELQRESGSARPVPLVAAAAPPPSAPSPSATLRLVPPTAPAPATTPGDASLAPRTPPAGAAAVGLSSSPSAPTSTPEPPSARHGTGGHRVASPHAIAPFAFEEPVYTPPQRSAVTPGRSARRGGGARRLALARLALVLGLVSAVGAGGWFLLRAWQRPTAAPSGWLRLESKPAGATVTVDGQPRGQTPLTLSVPAGAYRVEFALGGETRAITVPVTASGEAFQLVSLYPAGPPGTLLVDSVPAGATVVLDGQARGRTPIELSGVAPGEHTLSVENAAARVEQTVEVMAGARVPVSVPLSGAIAVEAPFEVSVSDGAKALGRVQRGTVAVATGTRRLTFANATLNYEETRDVEVQAGRAAPVVLRPPTGVLNLDADTAAQVFLDGRPLGLTPLPNVPVSLGTHEVLFRDARGGEVRYVIVVALGPAYRLRATLQSPSRPRGAPPRRR